MSGQSPDDRILELLEQWDESHKRGIEIPVAELCRDCPELGEELRNRIDALEATHWLDKPSDNADPPAKTDPR